MGRKVRKSNAVTANTDTGNLFKSSVSVKNKPLFSARKKSGITGNSAISLAKNLSGGKAPTALFASKYTRRIIRQHHTLLKNKANLSVELQQLSQLEETKETTLKVKTITEKLTSIEREIEENGGITEYQKASIAGQSNTRGGDTSKLLVEWLQEGWKEKMNDKPFSLLEIGCLSADNECSRSGLFHPVERIDLNSQDPKNIKEQDFMERPIPNTSKTSGVDRFDFISLSLVVNYVPDHFQRGEMLRRTVDFLKSPEDQTTNSPFPGLFLVLPAPCVLNSRYFTEQRLYDIMNQLGYKLERRKESSKLVYWLFRLINQRRKSTKASKVFKREQINPGANKNNFSICLK